MLRIVSKSESARLLRLGLILPLLFLALGPLGANPPSARSSPLEFRVRLTNEAAAGIAALGLEVPVTGRVFVIVTQDDTSEPREQIDVTGVPFWGKEVHRLRGGRGVTLSDRDRRVLGYPLEKIAQLPPGDYFVQAFLNVYTTFQRADGHTVQMHQDAGDGQWFWESPGNAYSEVQSIHLDPGQRRAVRLDLTQVIQPPEPLQPDQVLQQGNYADTDWVKYIKIRSDVVSAFWGQDMYIGANILLPSGYSENTDTYYPVIYLQGHFPGGGAPFGFGRGGEFDAFWTSDESPRFIAVTFRDANPYYDTSYSVNSANVGPYGDAILGELIPYIEENFRVLREPWARVLAGGSTGGWEALAMKVWWPDFFGGTWAWCPDSVNFHYHQLVDVYDEENAYFTEYDWVKVERPSAREPDGNLLFTIKQENYWERAMGPDDRSGGQWDIWEAVYSPRGPDGYPHPVWDPVTGAIDHTVAEYWRQNYDITYKIQQAWAVLGPKLDGQLTVTNGMMDTYYLNEATYLLQEAIEELDPDADIVFDYGFREPHCWMGESPNNPAEEMSNMEFIQLAADWLEAHRP